MIDNFSLHIENLARENDGSYIDAIIQYCDEFDIYEFEEVIPLLNPIILNKLKVEFVEKKFMPAMKIENSLKDFFS